MLCLTVYYSSRNSVIFNIMRPDKGVERPYQYPPNKLRSIKLSVAENTDIIAFQDISRDTTQSLLGNKATWFRCISNSADNFFFSCLMLHIHCNMRFIAPFGCSWRQSVLLTSGLEGFVVSAGSFSLWLARKNRKTINNCVQKQSQSCVSLHNNPNCDRPYCVRR